MKKDVFKKAMSLVLVASLAFGTGNTQLNPLYSGVQKVKAAKSIDNLRDKVTSSAIPNQTLLSVLQQLTGKGTDMTFLDLSEYKGDIDLSAYPDIDSVDGLGYAMSASSFQLGNLTKLTSISKYEFNECRMTDITLPDTIHTIGEYAFYNCKSLKNINVPTSTTKICNNAFDGCSAIEKILLPEGLVEIEQEAFMKCTSLKEITIPEKTLTLGDNMFHSCSSLKTAVLPSKLTRIPNGFFQATGSLLKVEIPIPVTEIGKNAFLASGIPSLDLSPCNGLWLIDEAAFQAARITKITFPKNSLETIGVQAFAQSSLYTTVNPDTKEAEGAVNIPDSVGVIAKGAFRSSSRMQSIKLPAKLEVIEEEVFSESYALQEVEIKDIENSKLHRISKYAFYSCVQFYNIQFMKGLKQLTVIEASAFDSCMETVKEIDASGNIKDKKDEYNQSIYVGMNSAYIPNCVQEIQENAFANNAALKNLVLGTKDEGVPQCLKTIGVGAFSECYNLGQVEFPQTLETIGDGAFSGCYRFGDIKLGEMVKEIGNQAFYNCGVQLFKNVYMKGGYTSEEELKRIQANAPASGGAVATVELYVPSNEAFQKIETVEINTSAVSEQMKKDEGYTVQIYYGDSTVTATNGSLYYKQEVYGTEKVDISACNGVKLGKKVFSDCVNLKEALLPDTLEEIPEATFQGCAYVEVDVNKTTIQNAFIGLEEVKLPIALKTIGDSAFKSCYAFDLENGTLGEYLETIGDGAFEECRSITKAVFQRSLKSIGGRAFYNCAIFIIVDPNDREKDIMVKNKGLQTIELKNATALEEIGTYAFGRTAIKEASLMSSDKLKEIPSRLFTGCSFLTDVYIPDYVEKIGDYVFSNCTQFGSLKIPASTTVDPTICTSALGKFSDLAITLRPVPKDNSIVLGNEIELPLYALHNNGNIWIDQIIVNDNEVIYNHETGTGTMGNDYITCSLVVTSKGTKGIKIKANKVTAAPIKLTVKTMVQYVKYTDPNTGTPYVTKSRPSVDFNIIVTEIPCKDITFANDIVTLGINNTTTGVKVQPSFSPVDHSDQISWSIVEGSENITIVPSEEDNGATAVIKATGNFYGTSKVAVKAGEVTKYFYVNIVAPATSVDFKELDVKVELGKTIDLQSELSYSSIYDAEKDKHPDLVVYTSSDENVAIVKAKSDGGCTVEAKEVGTATITAKTLTGGRIATCNVTVYGEEVKLSLKDSDGNAVMNRTTIKSLEYEQTVFTYDLSATVVGVNPVCEVKDKSIAGCSVNTIDKVVAITAYKVGKTEITIYPRFTDKNTNGITLLVEVVSEETPVVRQMYMQKTLPNKVYTGKAIKPLVSVVDNTGKTLVFNQDYTFKYSSNTNVGIAKVTAVGKGDYAGLSVSKSFKIIPAKVTGVKVKKSGKKAVVSFKKAKGATKYQIMYSTKKGSGYKQLTTTSKVTFKSKNLTKGKTYYFKVRAYKVVSGKTYYGSYSDTKPLKIK